MEARIMEVDPQLYLQMGKKSISKGMERLQNLAHRYHSISGKSAIFGEIITYLQSLQSKIKEIECLAQREEAHVSSNINATDLHHRQDITQIREQNQEIEMVMNTENRPCSKRKRRSKVWEDFKKYRDKYGKEVAECNHCKKEFDGSSTKGTTHLNNHLKSCRLRNLGGADKAKEKSVIDPELNGSDLVQKIIKYGLNNIENGMLDVQQREKDKLRRYLDKLPCRFNVRTTWIEGDIYLTSIGFIDDSWKLKSSIIYCGSGDGYGLESMKSSLVEWNIDKKICSLAPFHDFYKEEAENICKWLNERSSLPFIGNCGMDELIFAMFNAWDLVLGKDISTNLYKLRDYVKTNVNNFKSVVEKAVSTSKKVTSLFVLGRWASDFEALEWLIGCREAFCELEHIDPHFKFINFIKEDWDDATLLYNCWKALKDWREGASKEYWEWRDDVLKEDWQVLKGWREDVNRYAIPNACLPLLCLLFPKLVQLEKSELHCFRKRWKAEFDENWQNSELGYSNYNNFRSKIQNEFSDRKLLQRDIW